MNTNELLQELECDGFEIRVDGTEICIRGPEPLDADLIETLRERKPEIIEYLTSADREFSAQISGAGLIPKWRDYLFERVEILVKHENYSPDEAREEVLAMIPFYQKLN